MQNGVAKIEDDSKQDVSGEELFRRYLVTGDEKSFEDLVALYEKGLYRFINRIVRDSYEAKQLTVETFAQLAVGGRKFAGDSSLKTYLFVIGRNLTTFHMRKRAMHDHISFEEVVETLCDEGETPESSMEREENKKRLHEFMRELKEEYHAVLVLLYFEDMSYREAGQAMNKSEQQIKALAHRAKAALKKKMKDKGFTYE